MENLINLLKTHKKVAILVPIILLISIAIIVLFTSVTLSHFKNLNLEENTVLASNATNLAVNIAIASDDFLFVETLEINEKSEEEKAEDTEKDKEEELKAKEEEEKKLEEEKKSKEQEEKNKNNSQKENNNQNTVSSNSYYIKINRQANTVTVYTKDASGNYTVPVRAMVCSTGYASPTGGVYSMYKIGTWHTLMGGVYGQYCTQITGDILFHSVPYLRRGDNASLEYWAYDRLGTTASAGCVRLTTADAQWIYYNCSNGTKVEFYSSSTPGPLGKPTATKISDEGDPYRNWDPTDPNPNNPWRNKQTQVQQVQNQTQSQNQQSSSENTSSSNNSSVTVTSIENTNKQNTTSNSTNNKITNTNTNTNINTNMNTSNNSNNTTNSSNTTNTTTNKTNNTLNITNNTVNKTNNTSNVTNNSANTSNNTNPKPNNTSNSLNNTVNIISNTSTKNTSSTNTTSNSGKNNEKN